MNAPAIILVRPQMGENIGATARAMSNFGLSDLRIVAPRDGWPNEKATQMAAHATPILERARICASFAEATCDLQRLYATSARGRDMTKPCVTPRKAIAGCQREMAAEIRSGFVFGPERTGLTNEEVALADMLVTVPTGSENASLNLAQSVVILAYEWCVAAGTDMPAQTTSRAASPVNAEKLSPPATREELEGFFRHLETRLDAAHFFKTVETRPKMWRGLRSLFVRASLSEQEVRTLRGMVRALGETPE